MASAFSFSVERNAVRKGVVRIVRRRTLKVGEEWLEWVFTVKTAGLTPTGRRRTFLSRRSSSAVVVSVKLNCTCSSTLVCRVTIGGGVPHQALEHDFSKTVAVTFPECGTVGDIRTDGLHLDVNVEEVSRTTPIETGICAFPDLWQMLLSGGTVSL